MRKLVTKTYDKVMCALFALLVSSPAFAAGGSDKWIEADTNWETYIKNGIKVAQGISLALAILAGLKLFTMWLSGSEQGHDKGALVKWGIGTFVIIAFFAFITFFEKSILGS